MPLPTPNQLFLYDLRAPMVDTLDQTIASARFVAIDETRELRAQAARNEVAERRRITVKLKTALAHGGLLTHYQPQVQLSSGRICGAEAVIRLMHRRRGLIPAAQFMPVAERSDIINEIGNWLLHDACTEAMRWPARLTVSVNLALRQLRSGRLAKQVIEALSRSGLASSRLELELSEAMLIDDHEDTKFGLLAVQGLGVGLVLDHFGANYGSLSALKRVQLRAIKLDRSMIQQHSLRDDAILRATIETAHALGCLVVADGVENAAQAEALADRGCNAGQGPYFSMAMAGEALRDHVINYVHCRR